ncbi:hypothetical protein EVAR_73008_1 [Eumeta japonica]|uniref:Retrotransposon gag domain-containing protein n=1 Tax=Eumeta variegata TaxID=151549 RepID=A0A4C1TD12_EUMVA|nr:hypothetical protein EVAR_73008_1 [Eumeta japonica]
MDVSDNLHSQISELCGMLENVISVIQQQTNNNACNRLQSQNEVSDDVAEQRNEPVALGHENLHERETPIVWRDLVAALREEFGVEPDEVDISFKMQNATPKPDESINEYCFRMSALGKRNYLSEAAIIKYTREGLNHRELQIAIATIRFKTTKEMRATNYEYFSNMASTSHNMKTAASYRRNDFANKAVGKQNDKSVKSQAER